MFRALAITAIAVVAASGLVYGASAVTAPSAQAAPSGQFNPENIISDAQFFNANAMSAADIQNFIQSQPCSPSDGVPCLKDYRESTPTKGDQGAGHCTQYSGAANESAATIIAKVAQACRISPEVLLVLMQKEQSLLTNPSSYGYERAMGWGCPDTSGCDSLYFGFFNQVYRSAWQFREYTLNPGEWRYRIGPSFVQYSPNADCGGTVLNIQNQATANLYNYTPYQPNQAALDNMYGTGDSCSSYGNRNFWRMYYDWFGSPVDQSPVGVVENLQPIPGGIGVWGWALDGDTGNPIQIQINVNDRAVFTGTANGSRPDVGAQYGLGDNHGFGFTIPVPDGVQRVCVWGINVGSGQNVQFGCYTVSVGGSAKGVVESIAPQPGGLGVWGWALDPSSASPVGIQIWADGRFAGGGAANGSRPDVGAANPLYGDQHGFGLTVPLAVGTHSVCVYAFKVGSTTASTQLGCYTATVGGPPVGALDYISTGPGTVNAYGWAVDPDTTSPIDVSFVLDGQTIGSTTASLTRSWFGVMTTFGYNHGFAQKLTVPVGKHVLCIVGINVPSGANPQMNCQNIEVGGSPVGAIENGVTGFGTISAYGYAYDLDTANPINVQVNVDDKNAGTGLASAARPDLSSTIPADYGTTHGYGVTVPASPGDHRVCVWGINTGYGGNVQFGCFTRTVSGAPAGQVEYIQPTSTGFTVWGYALDPHNSNPIGIQVYVDGVFSNGGAASNPRADIGVSYPGYGSSHAFGVPVVTTPGSHQICTWAIGQESGNNTLLGCYTMSR
jgi:hypothetical protein